MNLSIVIPVYNADDYLDVCLHGLVEQIWRLCGDGDAGENVEIIAVDDGSTDRSLIKLKEYADRYDFVKLIHQENAGPAAARNAGLRTSSGDWVWFIDPDDYADEAALEAIFTAVSQAEGDKTDASPDVIIFDAYEITGADGSKAEISAWEHFGESCAFTSEEDLGILQRAVLYPRDIRALADSVPGKVVPMAAPWDKIYRRDFLTENLLIYNEELRVLDDMYFNMEVFGRAKRVDYVKKAIYHYVRNDGSITSSYTEDRVSRDLAVWEAINRYLESRGGSEELRRSYYKRIIRSYAICCKRSIFHPYNPMSRSDQVKYAVRVMRLPDYDDAFRKVRLWSLEWMLIPVAIFGRLHWGGGMWILSRMERTHA